MMQPWYLSPFIVRGVAWSFRLTTVLPDLAWAQARTGTGSATLLAQADRAGGARERFGK
jgi:hypothetical protein